MVIDLNGVQWTYTTQEAEDTVKWIEADIAYFEKQEKQYRKSGHIWMADKVLENITNSHNLIKVFQDAMKDN